MLPSLSRQEGADPVVPLGNRACIFVAILSMLVARRIKLRSLSIAVWGLCQHIWWLWIMAAALVITVHEKFARGKSC